MGRTATSPTPIQEALLTMRHAREQGFSSILFGLSGGKDSLTMIDIAVRAKIFDRIECFFMYLVPGLRCLEPHIDAFAADRGLKLHKIPHYVLANFFTKGRHTHAFAQADKISRNLRMRHMEALLRQRTGIELIGYGWKSRDSLQRMTMVERCQGLDTKWKRIFPLWRWSQAQVYAYIRTRRLRVPHVLTLNSRRVGDVSLDLDSLRQLREEYPDDYEKVLKVFPLAETQLVREQLFGQRGIVRLNPDGSPRDPSPGPEPVPEIRDQAGASGAVDQRAV